MAPNLDKVKVLRCRWLNSFSISSFSMEETEAFARLCKLLTVKGLVALKNAFDEIHPFPDLRAVLDANKKSLLKLKRSKVINSSHWNLLFPAPGTWPNSKTFDITLITVLLRHVCGFPPNEWNAMPSDKDNSLYANVRRIKLLGNQVYANATSNAIDSELFEDLWRKIAETLVSLKVPEVEINNLKISPVEPENDLIDWSFQSSMWFPEEVEAASPNEKRLNSKKRKTCTDSIFIEFVCDYIAKRDDASRFVTLRKENKSCYLQFTNIDDLSQFFFEFKKSKGIRAPRDDAKRVKDSFKSHMRGLAKVGLAEVGRGTDFGRSFLQYEIKNEQLLESLRSSYAVKGNLDKVDGDVATSNEPSPDTQESPDPWKWIKTSKVHQEKFKKLIEHGQEHPEDVKEFDGVRVCCSADFLIAPGADGTRVYVGLGKDGCEKAVKRLPRDICTSLAEHEKKILLKVKSTNVVKYWFLSDSKYDKEYLFLILDLCEETLEDFVNRQKSTEVIREIAPDIIRQVLEGLVDLHHGETPILHRDLKPMNILRNVDGKWLLADFGISRFLQKDDTTHLSVQRGTKDWRAVETYASNGVSDQVRYKKESDIQVAGMVAFYILTEGEHPFGKEGFRLPNILAAKPVGLEKLNFAANDLVSWMLEHNPKDRPSAKEALKHPYLQSKRQQFEMLCKIGNQPEIKKEDNGSSVVVKLNSDPTNWKTLMEPEVLNYLCTDDVNGKLKTFKYRSSWTECLRLIRNVHQHWNDRAHPLPHPAAYYIVSDLKEYFLKIFPKLPVEVHRIVRSCDWKERPDLKEYFT